MLKILKRHYRRLLMFSAGMSVFSTVLLAHATAGLPDVAYLAFYVMSLGLFAALSIVVYRLRPERRSVLEVAGFSGLITALAILYLPLPGITPVISGTVLFLLVLFGLSRFLRSKMSLQMGEGLVWKDRHGAELPYPARLAWMHLIPGATELKGHSTGMLSAMEEDEEDPNVIHVTFSGRGQRNASYKLTYLEKDPPVTCRFLFEGKEADGNKVHGIFAAHINILDHRTCFIAVNEERMGLSLGAYIERWFDDVMGYQVDRLRATLDKYHGDGQGITKPMPKTSEA
ncbi:hypothetical protein [Litoreibacter roseus]|uniref:Uncharacterized protein n=1 Tax=Litoreibacter roseus TaxID=2601869 RepID=A0A6N6JKX6_9RHOB|nr:hypothetical protein [Litoreibacter roseus]GFE65842.1 hypothetical protein KIN_29160 [Litoreibacter roseus]